MDILQLFVNDVSSQRGRIQQVAAQSGLKVKTLRAILYKVRAHQTVDPRHSTIEGLRRVYDRKAA